VVNIPSPDPDKRGPYPVFGLPYRIETIDFTGTKYDGRGYKLELQKNRSRRQRDPAQAGIPM